MQIEANKSGKVLSVFGLVMINVIAVDNLRSLPAGAEYGFSLIFFYLLAAVMFFIPTALVAAELATAWPNTGGVYVWVRTAFGKGAGLLAIWLQWIYNVVWYPTILTFIASTLAYFVDPALANNKAYVLAIVLSSWWLATWLNCLGMKASSRISTLGAIVGTIIPMAAITILGVIWLNSGKASQIVFSAKALLPDISNINNLAFLTTIIFGLMGLEMSAVHAGDVKNPKRDYPRALLWSSLLIIVTLTLASLAIAVVVPNAKLSVLTGLIDAYAVFFHSYHLTWCIPVIVALIVISSFASVSAWVIGPARGLMIALEENNIQSRWLKCNSKGMPTGLLVLQGIIVTLLTSVFVLEPTVNAAYWLLSAMTSQLAVLFYLFLFAAAIYLRYQNANTERAFRIPGGKLGMWIVAGLGSVTCIITFVLGFIPPTGVQIGKLWHFELTLVLGTVVFCLLPLVIYLLKMKTAINKNYSYAQS